MSSPFLSFQGDIENRDLLINALRAFLTGKTEVQHLGRKWKSRCFYDKRLLEVPSFLRTIVHITSPDNKGRCRIKIEVPALTGEDNTHTIMGYISTNKSGEPSIFFFKERPEYQVRIEMARKLVTSGKCTKADLSGVLSERELGAI